MSMRATYRNLFGGPPDAALGRLEATGTQGLSQMGPATGRMPGRDLREAPDRHQGICGSHRARTRFVHRAQELLRSFPEEDPGILSLRWRAQRLR